MSNKHIIKNCPAYSKDALDFCFAKNATQAICYNCNDCVIKCIKSKLDYLKCYINNDDSVNLSKMNEIIDDTVQLLDIQEVE